MSSHSGKPSPPPAGQDAFRSLVEIMAQLRTPGTGCPWDLEQTFETIAPYTIEEAYEVADAIERQDYGELKSELGDLLFQSVFHAQMAKEAGHFDIDDVVGAIVDKMVNRHPHVFGDGDVANAAAQTEAWEAMKARERSRKAAEGKEAPSAMDGVAKALPALMRAQKLTKRAAREGFDWPNYRQVLEKLDEEVAEVVEAAERPELDYAAVTEELGDILFVCANLCRKLEVDAEEALRAGNRKFERRFRRMEELARQQGQRFGDLALEEQEQLWSAAKRLERKTQA